tara:strand:+ start:7587 stop:7703 length:117 start_codon:yes stop_codon:yes gene_type:complete
MLSYFYYEYDRKVSNQKKIALNQNQNLKIDYTEKMLKD